MIPTMLSISQFLTISLLLIAPLHAHPTTMSSSAQTTEQCLLIVNATQSAHDSDTNPSLKINLRLLFEDLTAIPVADPAVTKSVLKGGSIQTGAFASSSLLGTAKVLEIDFTDFNVLGFTYGALKWTTDFDERSFQKPFCFEELVSDDEDIVKKRTQCSFQC
ncbi:hypothetical protein F5Y18DRAFT_53764 [Xylariaceae sp. FL1019]|nr:hypothetical protein F5Y18DRAFT_53764 [Xylariaceae sp. FL1019]